MSSDLRNGPTRFGVFQAPFHKIGINPTLSFERDLQLIELADRLGFQEAWIGEHHSGGHEPIASPEVFLAAAAERTRTIKLGTGVISLPYHNPFMVAERMVLLDHLSRGRAIMGFGPGQLASDAHMIGLDAGVLRERMLEAAEVVVRLCRGEVVTAETEWFSLCEARLQVLPYSRPTIDTVVAAVASPAGPRTAGRLGVGMINLAATSPAAFAALRDHWSIVEAEAAESGTQVSRADWRLAGIMHVAETAEQAREDCRYGFEEIWGYLGEISPLPASQETGFEGRIDEAIDAGNILIGTPDDAIRLIESLAEQSGGFGCFVMNLTDFASPPAREHAVELFAEYVIPHFRGQLAPMHASHDWVLGAKGAGSTTVWKDRTISAIEQATKTYAAEKQQ